MVEANRKHIKGLKKGTNQRILNGSDGTAKSQARKAMCNKYQS